MFTVTIHRETADAEYIEETFEGVVDVKTNPLTGDLALRFNDDRETETVPFDDFHMQSPLKNND